MLNDLFVNISELDIKILSVVGAASQAGFGVETNVNTNSTCSAFQSESNVMDDYWQLLLIASNALADYENLINKDMKLVKSVGQAMLGIDNEMAVSINAMSMKME